MKDKISGAKSKIENKIAYILLRILGAFFLLFIAFVTGEFSLLKRRKNKLSVKACLSYMKNKYGIEFKPIEDKDAELTFSMLKFSVETEGYPGEKIAVMEERLNNGDTLLFHDNFIAVKYRQETKNMAEKLAFDVFEKCRVLYNVDDRCLPDEFGEETTFEEFISRRASHLSIDVLLPPEHSAENKEEELKLLEQVCIKNHFVCVCNVFYSDDEDVYRNSNFEWELMNAKSNGKWWRENGQFVVSDDFTIGNEMWR